MNGLDTTNVQCPCCWQTFEVVIDCSVEQQEYVEDCYVCCRPLILTVTVVDGVIQSVDVESENN